VTTDHLGVNPIEALPPHLAERSRKLNAASSGPRQGAVTYVMDGALRSRENPALGTAITLANKLNAPIAVLLELREDLPFAADRHHFFLLEAMREVSQALAGLGMAVFPVVQRRGHRQDALAEIVARSALVVTEDVPTRWYRDRRQRLCDLAQEYGTVPVIAVDTACVVPMQLVGQPYTRAYQFRKATEHLRQARVGLPCDSPEYAVESANIDFCIETVNLDDSDLSNLIEACDIDHSVPPVADTPGGPTKAQHRWAWFRDNRLTSYAQLRNKAAREDGVSRLSPYLRYGMIAASQLARDAAAIGGKGPEKFLDELLVWREMSWTYAFHCLDHDTLATLPDWAMNTLRQHEVDPRPAIYSWQTLAFAETTDPFWNAAQFGYLRRGYLHNNLRMTWAKALPYWTESVQRCADLLVDLNNRFSLDGGDPNSYQGLFWCLGAFDRPFEPEKPILGRVRERSTLKHAERLDAPGFAAQQTRGGDLPSVAIVAGGLAGLMCGRILQAHGYAPMLFDKARGVGGRMTSKRFDDQTRADHGAQFFTVRDPRIKPYLDSWLTDGVVARWQPRFATLDPESHCHDPAKTRYVAVPRMRSLPSHLAANLAVETGVTIRAVHRTDTGRWRLESDDATYGDYDRLVVALPAPQAADLVQPVASAFADRLAQAELTPCLSAITRFDQRLPVEADVLTSDTGPIAWACRDSSKPQRSEQETWVLHANPNWSAKNLEQSTEAAAQAMLASLSQALHTTLPTPKELIGHRWRYAKVEHALDEPCVHDPVLGLGYCGDGCLGPRVESALLSGMAMAGRIFHSEPALRARAEPVEKGQP
jgi:photolyase PhrII